MKTPIAWTLALSAVLGLAIQPSHAAMQETQDDRALELRADEVLLDVIAVDSKGQPVLDLEKEEIEIYEDGKRQTPTSIRLVLGGPTLQPTAAPPPHSGEQQPFNVVIIVIDRATLEPGFLRPVSEAVEEFLGHRLGANDLVAVYGLDTQLSLLQDFTNDRSRLVAALLRAAGAGDGEPSDELTSSTLRSDAEPEPEPEPVYSLPPPAIRRDQVAQPTDKVQAAMLRELDRARRSVQETTHFYREQFRSRAFVYSLLGLVKAYGRLPGRKSLLVFSGGIPVDRMLEEQFLSLIGAANRANVAIYTVDSSGLRTSSRPGAEQVPTGASVLRDARRDRTLVVGGHSETGRVEEQLRGNTEAALSRLAEETGGVFVRNTNDLGRGFDVLAKDLRCYYTVSYVPPPAGARGEFRRIEVRTTRKGVRVRGRSGYFAVAGDAVVLPFERPILDALAAGAKRPKEGLRVAVSVEAFRIKGGWEVPVLVAIGGDGLEPLPGGGKSDPLAFEVGAVGLVRDASGAVVARLSRQSIFGVPREQARALEQSEIPMARFPQRLVLGPGTYRLELGVHDAQAERFGIVTREFTIDPVPEGEVAGLSSLVVGRAATKEPIPTADPFVLPEGIRIVPEPTGQLSKARGDGLIAYFRVYGTPGRAYEVRIAAVDGTGSEVLTSPGMSVVPDASGEAVVARAFPLDPLPAGKYTLRVAVSREGDPPMTRSVAFEVRR